MECKKIVSLVIANSTELANKIISDTVFQGITATAGGFYAPQGRILRLGLQDEHLNSKIDSFNFNGPVPFDMSISAGIAYVRVIAVTLEEAMTKVEKYFEGDDYEC